MRRQQQQQQQGRVLSAAVGALCRALPPRSRPAPDTLRRARFDRPQASLDFWRLLYALLKQIHGGKWTESDATDNQIRFVKSALWYHGYGRPELYRLPSDGSAGSRELLLAFSWLLHRISLLEQLLARNRVKTGDETSVCTCEDDLLNSQKSTTEIAPEYELEDRVDVRYLQWLNGRLRFQWQSLHAQHQEQCKLLHKIHLFTSGSHMDQILGHFSVTETDLIRQPENYEQASDDQNHWILVLLNFQNNNVLRNFLPTGKCHCPPMMVQWAASRPTDNLLLLLVSLIQESDPANKQWVSLLQEEFSELLQLLESETMQLEAFLEWKQLEPVYWQWMIMIGISKDSCGSNSRTSLDGHGQAEPTEVLTSLNQGFLVVPQIAEFYMGTGDPVGVTAYCASLAADGALLNSETVLDNMAEEGNMCESQDAHEEKSGLPKATSSCPWADSLTGQIDRLSRDLRTLHDQLQKLVTHRKAAWCEKVKTKEEELQKEGFSATARKIQESVELKLLDLTYLCAPKKKKMHGSCRLVFRSKHPASKTGFHRSVSKEPASAVSAPEVIRELQMREASLERELKQLQEECRQRLDEIAEGLDGVICVSP